jgi:hypothetical protein
MCIVYPFLFLDGEADGLQSDDVQQVALDHAVGEAFFDGRLAHKEAGSGQASTPPICLTGHRLAE